MQSKVKAVFSFLVIFFMAHFSTGIAAMKNSSASSNIEVTFLANCGFVLKYEAQLFLIDPPTAEKCDNETAINRFFSDAASGNTPYEKITAVFITHPHDDHINIPGILNLLKNHPETKLYSAENTISEIKRKAPKLFDSLYNRFEEIKPDSSGFAVLTFDNTIVDVLHCLHAGAPNYTLDDLCFAFHFGNRSCFYMSDIDPGYNSNYNSINAWLTENTPPDILIAPDAALYKNEWSSEKGISLITDKMRPEIVIPMHFKLSDLEKTKSAVSICFPQLFIFSHHLESHSF